ncbi:MAG: Threonine--tRNA ligase [Microgenomates bacterium 39_7]|nr:MAG: Threonine--tRNA ligase [Microgenomates bacterium 39_7]
MSKNSHPNQFNNDAQDLASLRHTTEHVLTYAMQRLYGKDRIIMAMGPATDDGFYFDFDTPEDFSVNEEMLKKIEKEMLKLIKADLKMLKLELGVSVLRKVFADNPYKQEWLDGIENSQEQATVYLMGTEEQLEHDQELLQQAEEESELDSSSLQSFIDLCKGPHLESTKQIRAFKLLSVAGAYWHGDEKNKMLTRIYGTAFPTKEELKHFIWQREEAKKRDHRKIGQKMNLFMFDEEFGQGLPLYKPKGAMLRKLIMDFAFETYLKRGYQPVSTPHIARLGLWETSGHWNFYRDSMYSPMEIDDEQYLLKPMNCPGHVKIYTSDLHSYRDLPVRLAEMGTVYRYEKSGEINGILRPRGFTQDDAHIICTPSQLKDELLEVIDLTKYIYSRFGFSDPKISLSVRDPEDKTKYMGEDDKWQLAEEALEAVLVEKEIPYERIEGEAAFYGPKIDFMFEDALGRAQQLTTIQVDFNLPEKFNMYYIDEKGEKQQPFMLHRALLGSLERFMGVLIEHTAGNFPFWLAPVQVKVLPITDDQIEYAHQVAKQLRKKEMRVEVDDRSATLGSKIRDAETQRVPYMLIVGAKEQAEGTVSVRERDKKEQQVVEVEEFISNSQLLIENKFS